MTKADKCHTTSARVAPIGAEPPPVESETSPEQIYHRMRSRALQAHRPRRNTATAPDARLIQICEKLREVHGAYDAGYVACRDDKTREKSFEPLDAVWWKAAAALMQQQPPRTRQGAQAAARTLLSDPALDSYAEAASGRDVIAWLSRACAEHLGWSNLRPRPTDAALLDLCNQFDSDTLETQRYDAAAKVTEAESLANDVIVQRWTDTLEKITGTRAETQAGIRAKAKALGQALTMCVAVELQASFEDQATAADSLAMSLVRDIAAVSA